jgi:nicotinate phosphoribosyltransferase
MCLATLARNDEELAFSPYEVLRIWQKTYKGALRIFLPDTYGTTGFLRRAPEWVADWTGVRIDSKDPIEGGEEMIAWWKSKGQNPEEKRILFSDGLDIHTIEHLHAHFRGRARIGFGWGTMLTNDFTGCHPHDNKRAFAPISLVCKVVEANGKPAVKLSDNIAKAIGPATEIERYLRVFGREGSSERPVIV